MPYTVHTLDGQAHTYPGPRYIQVNDAGLLSVHRDVPQDRYGSPSEGPVVAAYPAGQWTHYHVEPAPYETDAQASEDTGNTEDAEDEARQARLLADIAAQNAWVKEHKAYVASGRKAARAR